MAEAFLADIVQYQKEIKSKSDAVLSFTRETADWLLQVEDQREAARIASDTKASTHRCGERGRVMER